MMAWMKSYRYLFFGHVNLLYHSVPLYKFVAEDWFVNPEENLVYLAGRMSIQTTLQVTGDMGARIVSINADLALNGRNTVADQTSWATKVHLQTFSRATNL